MQFFTPLDLPATPSWQLFSSSRLLLLGSCFAAEVGERLSRVLPAGQVCINPFGALYNPASLAGALRLLLAPEVSRTDTVEESLFAGRDGFWHSWLFDTHHSAPSREECRARCLASIHDVDLTNTDILVLTLGTDRAYRLRDGDERVVANCHKEPAARFAEETVEASCLSEVLDEVQTRCPALHILLTVSPYRYAKYGFHASQLSKARLLLWVDTYVQQGDGRISYFPAYELLLDELRDYRFYAPDMLHPSPQAVDYIYERFAAWCFSPELNAAAPARLKLWKQQQHRPLS